MMWDLQDAFGGRLPSRCRSRCGRRRRRRHEARAAAASRWTWVLLLLRGEEMLLLPLVRRLRLSCRSRRLRLRCYRLRLRLSCQPGRLLLGSCCRCRGPLQCTGGLLATGPWKIGSGRGRRQRGDSRCRDRGRQGCARTCCCRGSRINWLCSQLP